jgi:hypothetical protein
VLFVSVDEYSEVLIAMTCAVYSSRIIPEHSLEAMEEERLESIIPHLVAFGEDEVIDAARKSDHAAVDVACGKSLLRFVKDVSVYLPENIAKIAAYLYGMWFDYLSRRTGLQGEGVGGEEPLDYGKEEFARYVIEKVGAMSSKFSEEDRTAVRMLSAFVLFREDMHIPESKRTHGLWALMDLLYRKTRETERLSRTLHLAMIREEIWKKNLFAG